MNVHSAQKSKEEEKHNMTTFFHRDSEGTLILYLTEVLIPKS